ncbi:flavin reductase family protein [Streptomyces sp. TRM70350]|uniref:flavin reductase family protein n=1 Tax=Streptomyces sp. TRM70350 TaxID=2856165 RepID=UPI001C48B64B|nr:flavin reductase family protein [Streptomyces sp. TRM70350]MBV7699838.1 flavin reductase family protein [Streptomyces sp. TRM70350]
MSAAARSLTRTPERQPIEPLSLRRVCGLFTTGVTVVATGPSGRAEGTTVNSFTSVSLEPPLVLFCLHKQSRLHGLLQESGGFTVNFLSGRQQPLARHFAGKRPDAFAGVPHHFTADGLPALSEALAYIACTTVDVHAAGDHDIVIGEVVELGAPQHGQEPLIFFDGSLGPLETGAGRFSRAGEPPAPARVS